MIKITGQGSCLRWPAARVCSETHPLEQNDLMPDLQNPLAEQKQYCVRPAC